MTSYKVRTRATSDILRIEADEFQLATAHETTVKFYQARNDRRTFIGVVHDVISVIPEYETKADARGAASGSYDEGYLAGREMQARFGRSAEGTKEAFLNCRARSYAKGRKEVTFETADKIKDVYAKLSRASRRQLYGAYPAGMDELEAANRHVHSYETALQDFMREMGYAAG